VSTAIADSITNREELNSFLKIRLKGDTKTNYNFQLKKLPIDQQT